MPLLPMAIPSVMAMVLNSTGVPPLARTPSAACSASSRRPMLQGETLDQVWTTPIIGRARASSSSPVARSMARAGACAGPDLMASLLRGVEAGWFGFKWCSWFSSKGLWPKKNPALRSAGFVEGAVVSVLRADSSRT